MAAESTTLPTTPDEESHLVTYPRFLWECVKISFDGGPAFYAWMTVLTAIALVGASGGGKSTIVNLAARFYEPTGGAILVNGEDLRDRSMEWYQSNLGIVLQSPHLFRTAEH